MKKFSDYSKCKTSGEKSDGTNGSFTQSDSIFSGNSNAFEMLNKLSAKYSGANSSELLNAIFQEAARAKKAGTLSQAEIQSFVDTISPMLTAAQKNQLNSVVERIKSIK